MSPRKNTQKAEEQYPPAPSAEDDAVSIGDDELEAFSQQVIDEYLAYNAMNDLRLGNGEGNHVSDDASEGLQSTPDGCERHEHDEPTPPRSNRNEPDVHDQAHQRPQTPLQYCAIPVAPAPAIILRDIAQTAPVAPFSAPATNFWSPYLAAPSHLYEQPRRENRQQAFVPTGGFFEDRYPEGVVPGGYSRGLEGMHYDTFPNWTVPVRRHMHRRQNERMPFSWMHPIDRDISRPMTPPFVFEMWADAFGMSRRIEEDMAALRKKLERLQEFCYWP